MPTLDNDFIKRYRTWLKMFNEDDLHIDYATGNHYKFHNHELVYFRNNPKEPYVERDIDRRKPMKLFKGSYRPTGATLANHFVKQRDHSLFLIQPANDVLLLLIDIDNKSGDADVDGAAKLVLKKYLGGHGYVEYSRHGAGRHIYFLLGVEHVPPLQVHDILDQWGQIVAADSEIAAFGVSFDRVFYGLPSVWTGEKGCYSLLKRGNELKLPFCPEFEDSLSILKSLPVLPFELLAASLVAPAAAAYTQGCDIGITKDAP